jgi:hypothetical protein
MATVETTPRSEKRATFEDKVRIMLLEQDVDTMEGGLNAVVDEQKRGNKLLMGILTMLSGGAILLAADVIVRGGIGGG